MTHLAIHRPVTILMGVLAFVLMVAVSFTYQRVERLPHVSIPVISVIIQEPLTSAEDIEKLITEHVENAMVGIAGVDTLTSTSSEGRAVIRVQMVQGADLDLSSLEV